MLVRGRVGGRAVAAPRLALVERQLHDRISHQQNLSSSEHKGRMDDLLDQVKAAQQRGLCGWTKKEARSRRREE